MRSTTFILVLGSMVGGFLRPSGAAKAAEGHDPHGPEIHSDDSHALEGAESSHHGGDHHAAVSDVRRQLSPVIPPERPNLLVELGERFLDTGKVGPTWELPTGAVWHPALWVYGNYRVAAQSFDNGVARTAELATRLDLFANVRLSGTERLLMGFRPLDRGNGRFTTYQLHPTPAAGQDRFMDNFNFDLQTFFFEGDIGEIFPRLDSDETGTWDVYFSVGKQPLLIQDGFLVNDFVTGVGFSRINDHFFGAGSFRTTMFYGWGDINRGTNQPGGILEDGSAGMYGFFTEADFRKTTVNFDTVYINANDFSGDALFSGISFNQRFGKTNTIFRLNTSIPMDDQVANLVGRGTLATSEVSWQPTATHDIVYVNAFATDRRFTSAARDSIVGGPLGRIGILFAAQGLGSYGTPLSNQASRTAGGAIGYQHQIDAARRRQIIFELGGRTDTDDTEQAAYAAGVRYRHALGRHFILQGDVFTADYENVQDRGSGFRFETLVKF